MGGVINWKKRRMFQTSNSVGKTYGEGPVWVGLKPIPGVGKGDNSKNQIWREFTRPAGCQIVKTLTSLKPYALSSV